MCGAKSTALLATAALVAAGMFVSVVSRTAYADDFVPVSISGIVFNDFNGDGIYDPLNDVSQDGWVIGLSLEQDDTETLVQTTTSVGGVFTFTNVQPGIYGVYEEARRGWTLTTPWPPAITVSSWDVGNIAFGNFQDARVSGRVFEDLTGNGFSPDDMPFAMPVRVELWWDSYPYPASFTTTDANGWYEFPSVVTGPYTVREVVPAGYSLTADLGRTIYPTSGSVSDGNDFDNFLLLLGLSMLALQPVEGAPFNGAVARLSAGEASHVGDFTATIAWGDGITSAGSLTSDPNGGFLVNGGHTYAEDGAYTLAVSVTEIGGPTAAGSESVIVRDAALHALGESGPFRSATFSGVVATFTDDDPNGVTSDYSAMIDWGDGSNSIGIVGNGQGGFTVSGSHSFTEGRFAITTSISDQGGASTSATSTLTIDWTPPTTSASVSVNVLTLNAVDNLTGVQARYYTLNGGPAYLYTSPVALKSGRYTIQYWSVDGAGNVETAHDIQIKADHK
jgi:hypothetical protein